jgi:flagellar biosynthesis component FlhA
MWARVIGAFIVLIAITYMAQSLRIPRGTIAQPGPGFFPILVSLLLISVAICFMVSAIKEPRSHQDGLQAPARRRVISVLAALGGFCLLLPVAGYPFAAFALVGVMLWQLGASWGGVISISLVSAAVSYYVFAVILGVPLPGGIFG